MGYFSEIICEGDNYNIQKVLMDHKSDINMIIDSFDYLHFLNSIKNCIFYTTDYHYDKIGPILGINKTNPVI